MTTPLVSVLTPSYNQAIWLPENVASVRAQTYSRIEHIVMDGGSTDGSTEFLASCPSIAFQSGKDRGQSHALNMAFEASRGDIVGWLNSDDAYFATDAVEMAVRAFQDDPAVGVVYGHAVLAGPAGQILQVLWCPDHDLDLLRRHNYIVQPTVFIRRSVIEDGFVDESFDYMMDRELWLRLAMRHGFQRIDRILAIDRHHDLRKSYLRTDLAHLDQDRLNHLYGLPHGRLQSLLKKVRKATFRFKGLALVQEAQRSELAFNGRRDSNLKLATRQVLVSRRFMRRGVA